jgi:hypothetical protein
VDTARHAGVAGHVFVQGLQQGIMHAGIDLPVSGHGRLPHGPEEVQHGVDRRVQDCCLPLSGLLSGCRVFWCRVFWCRVPAQVRRELFGRQLRPRDVGRGGRRPSRLLVWGLV